MSVSAAPSGITCSCARPSRSSCLKSISRARRRAEPDAGHTNGVGTMKHIAFLASALLLASPALAAPDYSGSWEVAVREFGDKNYYLPMTDGRLMLEARGDSYTGRFNQIAFTGSLEKDGLHLSCTDKGKDCGKLVLQLSGGRLSGKGDMIASSPVISIPVTLEGRR